MSLVFCLLLALPPQDVEAESIRVLIQNLKQAPEAKRIKALQLLMDANPRAARPHAPEIAQLIGQTLYDVKKQCGPAWDSGKFLGYFGKEGVLPLLNLLGPEKSTQPKSTHQQVDVGQENVAHALFEAVSKLNGPTRQELWPDFQKVLETWLSDSKPERVPPPLISAASLLGNSTLPFFRKAMRHPTVALTYISKMKELKASATPLLVELLESDDATQKYHAILGLGNLGPDAAQAVPALKAFLKQTENVWFVSGHTGNKSDLWSARYNTFRTLGSIGPAAYPVTSQLIAMLNPKAESLHLQVAEALSKIGLRPQEVPELLEQMKQIKTESLSFNLARAFHSAGPDSIPVLEKALESDHPSVRTLALFALREWGTAARSTEKSVRKLLANERGRHQAILTLQSMGADTTDQLDWAWRQITDVKIIDNRHKTGYYAISEGYLILERIPASMEFLRKMLETGTPGQQAFVCYLLAKIKDLRPETITLLKRMFEQPRSDGLKEYIAAALFRTEPQYLLTWSGQKNFSTDLILSLDVAGRLSAGNWVIKEEERKGKK